MAILSVKTQSIGQIGVYPQIVYISTDDTQAEVTSVGYLNKVASQGVTFSEEDIALVSTKVSPSAKEISTTFYNVQYSASTGWSLIGGAGGVSLTGGTGITCTPSPIIGTGTISLQDSGVTSGQYYFGSGYVQVNQKGQVTSIQDAQNIVEAIALPGEQTAGVVSLITGSITVVTSAIKADSVVLLSYRDTGVPLVQPGTLSYGSIVADNQFVITSSNALDENDVAYLIVNPS